MFDVIIIGVKNIEILHEDTFSIIINKPAGLSVQGGKGIKISLDELLNQYLKDSDAKAHLVHRIDKDTSGILLAVKNSQAAARFSKVFGSPKKTKKIYTAVCAGQPPKNKGIITDELLIKGSLKKSQTAYNLIKIGKLEEINQPYSVLELELETGRMHQIRRHLAMHGSPILGDDKYGDFALNKKLKKTAGLKRLLLHASRLIINELDIDITAALPEYFDRYTCH